MHDLGFLLAGEPRSRGQKYSRVLTISLRYCDIHVAVDVMRIDSTKSGYDNVTRELLAHAEHFSKLYTACIGLGEMKAAESPSSDNITQTSWHRPSYRAALLKRPYAVGWGIFSRDVLDMCTRCEELKVPVRRTEKRLLNELNKQVRYPPPKKEIIRTPADKVG